MDSLYDPDSIVNSRKPLKAQGGTKDNWPWLQRWRMDAGEFQMKFLAHPDKCKNGFRLYTAHQFEREAGEDKKKNIKFFCTETTHGMKQVEVDDGEGGKKAISLLNRPCYICDMLEDIRRIDDGQWYDNVLDLDFQDILHNMSATQARCYLFPILLYAKEVDMGEAGAKKQRFVPSDSPMGAILSLRLGSDHADFNFYKLIIKLANANRAEFFAQDGLWCKYTKGERTQDLDVKKARPLTPAEQKCLKNFPDIDSYGKGVASGSFQRPSMAVGYDRQKALVRSTWWAKKMEKRFDYDFEDGVDEGLACKPPEPVKTKAVEEGDLWD